MIARRASKGRAISLMMPARCRTAGSRTAGLHRFILQGTQFFFGQRRLRCHDIGIIGTTTCALAPGRRSTTDGPAGLRSAARRSAGRGPPGTRRANGRRSAPCGSSRSARHGITGTRRATASARTRHDISARSTGHGALALPRGQPASLSGIGTP